MGKTSGYFYVIENINTIEACKTHNHLMCYSKDKGIEMERRDKKEREPGRRENTTTV